MKLLLLLNENPAGSHEDVRRAINKCNENGIITDKIIYPFLAKLAEIKKEKEVLKEIIEIAKNYKPDLIMWMHTDKFKVNKNVINELRNLNSRPVMGYWEGDLYQSPYRMVPNELLTLSSACDVVFAQGFGEMTEKMKAKGSKDIRFVPAFGDEKRFYPIQNANKKEFDIVIIGNNITSRNPLKINLDGTELRRRIVSEFCRRYYDKFAVFGMNWKGNCAKGIALHHAQHEIYSRSKITISVNNANGKYYFSNRLPIALLSGIPVIQNYEEGFDHLFRNCKEILFFKNLPELFQKAESLLLKPQEELDEIGERLNEFAKKYFLPEFVFTYMINVMTSIKYNNHSVANPWIS